MNYSKPLIIAWSILAAGSPEAAPRRSNPFVSHMFTADPSAHVWEDGRLYVYPSTDTSPASGYATMDGYHVFSTDDMITWTDHGEILHSDDVEWGRSSGGYMWAPDCAYKNGTYYYYFPHPSDGEGSHRDHWKIGVATSKSPVSGFKDQGYIQGLEPYIDPCVFMDDDGQAYLYYGGYGKPYVAKLKANMVEIEDRSVLMEGLDDFREGAFVFKRNGTYTMIYPDNSKGGHKMRHAVSKSPMGPWECKGVFLDKTNVLTTHGSCVEYKGQWYLFYHNGDLSGGQEHNRSICFDPMYFKGDGTIQMVAPSRGVALPTFHQDINYNGMFGTLDVGEYTAAALAEHGIENDAVSSLEVPAGYIVECFEEDRGKGKSWIFENNVIDLGAPGCDDTISSIKISRDDAPSNLVLNGSFEQGVQQTVSWWQGRRVAGVSRVLEHPADGYYALQYEGSRGMRHLTQKITLKPNTSYRLRASLKVDAGTKGEVWLEALEPFDAACSFKLDAGEKAGQWVEVSKIFNSGEHAEIALRLTTSKNFSGTCFWDDLALVEQGQSIILNNESS